VITVNCVGLGHWGPNLARVFASHPESKIGTVCDLSAERLALVRRKIPGTFQASDDAMATVADPEVAVIGSG
jgi:hypothetical protein